MSVYIQFALSAVRMRPDESRFKKNTVRHNMPARSHNTFDIGSSPASFSVLFIVQRDCDAFLKIARNAKFTQAEALR